MSKKLSLGSRSALRFDQIVSVAFLSLSLMLFDSYQPANLSIQADQQPQQIFLASSSAVPVRMARQISDPILTASSATVIDFDSGAILLDKNADQVYLPASTTKLMSALVVREAMNLSNQVTIPSIDLNNGSEIGLQPGEQYTIHNLLKALLIQSANDAAESLAANYPGGRSAFIARMNTKAQEIGMTRTIFENPTGFDGLNHQTTARDMAVLSVEVVNDPILKEIVKSPSEYITDISRSHQIFLKNSHQLVGVDPSVTGVKTGTTDGAGQVLVTQVEKDGHRLIIVVMGSGDRYVDTLNISNWIFATHRWLDPGEVDTNNQSSVTYYRAIL